MAPETPKQSLRSGKKQVKEEAETPRPSARKRAQRLQEYAIAAVKEIEAQAAKKTKAPAKTKDVEAPKGYYFVESQNVLERLLERATQEPLPIPENEAPVAVDPTYIPRSVLPDCSVAFEAVPVLSFPALTRAPHDAPAWIDENANEPDVNRHFDYARVWLQNTKGLTARESYETVAALYNTEGRLMREDYLADTDLTALIKVMVADADKTKFW